MILFLAMRNIARNKKNSVIIIALIAVITALFFAGNTVIGQSSRGLRAAYTASLTGDIVIEKAGEVSMSLFGANAPHLEDYFLIEPLPAYDKLVEIVEALPGLDRWTSQVSTGAYMKIAGARRAVLLTGIDAKPYFSLFPGITLERGGFLAENSYGAMITGALASGIESQTESSLAPGAAVSFTTAGKTGFKIREVPLAGIFAYQNTSSVLDNIVLADAQTVRALASVRAAGAGDSLSAQTAALLDGGAFDALSDDDAAPVNDAASSWEDNLRSLLQQETAEPEQQTGGDWNFIIITLRKGVNVKKTLALLNEQLAPYQASAVGWRTAAGVSAILVSVLQTLYNGGILIICIAGVIAIINILLIAVFKRTREIGTLRAIGASDGYIRRLLISENCFLGLAGGVLGVLAGVLGMALINALHITIKNDLIVNFLGVRELNIQFFPEYAAASIVFSLVLTLLSLIFPMETARRIEPAVAVREG